MFKSQTLNTDGSKIEVLFTVHHLPDSFNMASSNRRLSGNWSCSLLRSDLLLNFLFHNKVAQQEYFYIILIFHNVFHYSLITVIFSKLDMSDISRGKKERKQQCHRWCSRAYNVIIIRLCTKNIMAASIEKKRCRNPSSIDAVACLVARGTSSGPAKANELCSKTSCRCVGFIG